MDGERKNLTFLEMIGVCVCVYAGAAPIKHDGATVMKQLFFFFFLTCWSPRSTMDR